MALEFLEEIYEISKMIFRMKMCVECCNCGDIWMFSQEWNSCAEGIRSLYNDYLENKNPMADEIRVLVDEVRTNINNTMYCGAIIEERFIPFLYKIVEGAGNIDVEEDGYHFVSSKSGLLTMQSTVSGNYWHSLIDPLKEAWDKGSLLFRPNAKNIVIMGCGLGYLAYQLWRKSFESAHIYILENNPKMIDYARDFGVLNWINQEDVTIVLEESIDDLFCKFVTFDVDMSKSIFVIADWMVEGVDEKLKQQMFDYIENQKASIRYDARFNVNYYSNVDVFAGSLSELKKVQTEKNKDGQFIVVAAGPSLNKQMDYLREVQNEKIIVAVDGALKKLLANGIKPDYVTAIDPNKSLMHYLDGIEDQTEDITLIADSVTYWEYINHYRGPVYRVICADCKLNISDKAKFDIPDLGYHGTVSGLAIEVAAYFGAKIIELIGLDLSFPGGKHHADGIGVDTSNKVVGELLVKSVTGEMVETNPTFEKFIREIEVQIENHKDIKFINKSDSGAYIRGAFIGRWYEQFPAIDNAKNYFDKLADEGILSWNEKYFILRQYYNFLRDKGMSNSEIITSGIFDCAYNKICFAFNTLVNLQQNRRKAESKRFILLIVSQYSINDETTIRMLEDAEKFHNQFGYNVIIVNTNEYLGGERTSIDGIIENTDADIVLNDSVVYMGNRYPYIMCNVSMPNIEYIEKVCGSLLEYNIDGIVSYDSMSLFAETCKRLGMVEYRYGELNREECIG